MSRASDVCAAMELTALPPRIRATVELIAERNNLTAAELVAACVLVAASCEFVAVTLRAVEVKQVDRVAV
jgi:hypothetical protein